MPKHLDEDVLRRIVREETRAALTAMLPVNVLLLTYKQAAKWTNESRPPGDAREPLTVRDVRQWVELGFVPAVRFGSQEPRVPASDLEWNRSWLRHTREERDRDWTDQQQAERERAHARKRPLRRSDPAR
jgi:hypothetical protein